MYNDNYHFGGCTLYEGPFGYFTLLDVGNSMRYSDTRNKKDSTLDILKCVLLEGKLMHKSIVKRNKMVKGNSFYKN